MPELSALGTAFDIGNYGLGGSNAEAVALADGRYLVTWQNTVNPLVPINGVSDDNGTAILARFLNADGSPAGEAFQVNTSEAGFQNEPEVTQLAGGNVVIAWTSLGLDGNGEEAFARVYDSAGNAVSGEILLHGDSTDDQSHPEIAATSDGGFLATWLDERSSQTYDGDIYGQRFNADGTTNGVEFTVWNASRSDISRHETLVFDDGSIRIVTESPLIRSDGTLLDPYPVLNANSISTQNSPFASNFYSDAVRLTDGLYAMAGVSVLSPSQQTYEILVKVRDIANYDNPVDPADYSDLIASEDAFPVAAQNMVGIDMAALSDGGFIVVWGYYTSDNTFDVMAQLYDASYAKVGTNVLVHEASAENQSAPFVQQGADGNILIGWTDDRSDTESAFVITGRLFDMSGGGGGGGGTSTTPSAGNDSLTGTAAADNIDGLEGDDTITGLGGNDTLTGGDGKDQLSGGADNDLLLGDDFFAAYEPAISAQVYRLYQATLGRDPDGDGHRDWMLRLLGNEISLDGAAAGFVGSREFQNTYGALDDGDFIELLYQNVLGRASDAAGKQGWLDQLAGGASRAQVVTGFSESREFINNTAADAADFMASHTPAPWSDDVYRIYRATLGREPDEGGFLDWVGQLGSGTALETVVSGFVGSTEFQNTYGALGDDDFVELLYQNVLGRASDAAGKADWVSQLTNGASRETVVLGFSQSPEFQNNTASALEAWIRGLGEDDRLEGGAGDNTLAGGVLSDTFVFSASDGGSHILLDPEPWDTLEFSGFGYAADNDVRSHMSQNGDDVVFADQGVTITLNDIQLDDISDTMILI